MYSEATTIIEAGIHLRATSPGTNEQMENLAGSDLAQVTQ